MMEVFESLTLLDGIAGGVSALTCWSDLLYVGTVDGCILLLSLQLQREEGDGKCDDGGVWRGEGCSGAHPQTAWDQCAQSSVSGAEVEIRVSLGVGAQPVEQLVSMCCHACWLYVCVRACWLRRLVLVCCCHQVSELQRLGMLQATVPGEFCMRVMPPWVLPRCLLR